MSEHFNRMWESVNLAIDIAMAECDPVFFHRCNPVRRNNLARIAENTYRSIRSRLRLECYGTKNSEDNMDARKMASVMCCTLMEQMAICFDTESAVSLMEDREAAFKAREKKSDRIEFNRWIVDNFFINYKIAYLTGLIIVYDTLMADLLKKPDTAKFGEKLAQRGKIGQYPKTSGMDGFDVSMVLGLGRAGIRHEPINAFLLALQFYQIEMYTRKDLGIDESNNRL